MKKTTLAILAFLTLALAMPMKAQTVHTIGDSTMADYATDGSTDKRGWAQMFGQFFDDAITVNNRGKSGASSKSFYLESAYWTTVLKQISAGDYVMIQFSHNDEKNNGMDGDSVQAKTGDTSVDYRGTIPQTTYKSYLRKYVEETRALGATPIFVAPMCRKYFSGSSITRKGKHDLGDSYSVLQDDGTIVTASVGTDDHTMDYPYAMWEVAQEYDVPFIDLTTSSAEMYVSYGNTYCTANFFCTDDSTHPTALGATMIARLVAQELATLGIEGLSEHVQQSSDLLVNPTSIDFGKVYINQASTTEFSVSGLDLSPTEGTLTISATDGFTISDDKTNWASSYDIAYTGGSVTFTTLYIRAYLTEGGEQTGTLTVTNGNNTKTVAITAEGVELTDGEEVLLQWVLSADESYTLTGPATAIDESWSEMKVKNYAEPKSGATTWPDDCGISDQKTQRNVNTYDNEQWPGSEIDEVSTRWIQFGITANEGTILHVDSLGLYVGGAGGSGMRCRVSYSVNEDFSDCVAIAEYASAMTSNTMYAVSNKPIVELAAGQSLYLRIYPWYTSVATGKTLCLSYVTIHGIAEGTSSTGITAVSSAEAVSVAYYDIAGRQLAAKPQTGLYITKTTLADGTVRTTKAGAK